MQGESTYLYIYHDGHPLAVCVTLTMIMHKNAWEGIHHEDHYICHQHHRHYFLQANIQFDYEASSLRKLRLSLVFITVMYLRNCLRKTYDSLIMVIYSRTIDILCCHLRGTPPCVYNHNMASCTSSTWQWPMGRNTCTWVTSWRHPDSHQQISVNLMMHAPRYFVKGGNIQPKGDIL